MYILSSAFHAKHRFHPQETIYRLIGNRKYINMVNNNYRFIFSKHLLMFFFSLSTRTFQVLSLPSLYHCQKYKIQTLLLCVLISQDCQKNVQQTGYLKRKIYCFPVLEARCPKVRCCRAMVPQNLQERTFLHLFLASGGWSTIFGVSWLTAEAFQSLIPLSYGILSCFCV